MSCNNNNAAAAIIAFISGTVISATAALLLTPTPNREVREKLSGLTESATEQMKRITRKTKFRTASKTKGNEFQYDSGNAWI